MGADHGHLEEPAPADAVDPFAQPFPVLGVVLVGIDDAAHHVVDLGPVRRVVGQVDESYFGGKRKGKRGRGAAGKIPVFGLLQRGGKVYTKIIPDASAASLMPIIQRKIVPDSIVYSDCWRGYNVLDVSDFHHFRINHSKLFADRHNHINGIENFWNQAKRNLRKFNGIPKAQFGLYLKECEWRFNNSDPSNQVSHLKQWVKHHLR